MLDIKRIREDADGLRRGLRKKGVDGSLLERVLERDARRRTLLTELEQQRSERNRASKEIGRLKQSGQDASAQQATVRELGVRIQEMTQAVRAVEIERDDSLLSLPNVPHESVPEGADSAANVQVRAWGEPRAFDFEPALHMDIGERLGLFDFQRGAKMSGAGFPLLVGEGARLQRALVRFMLDVHVREHGYTEISPPVLCHSASMTGTGQLPKMGDDMYRVADEDLWLIPTAEVPVTNFFRDEIVERSLPIRLTAHSLCFRKEAGAAGKETRGFIRVHQFEKVEMVKFVEPEQSYAELESLLENAETILQRLELPYRVLTLCTGDLSFAAAKCYDIELWAPGQNDWLEVSSCSNFEDFQARRAGIRYRDSEGRLRFVHTLNGSGVALPRLMVGVLENGVQADGTRTEPSALAPYMDGQETLDLPS